MALGDPYVTAAELKTYLKITGSAYDTQVDDARAAASRAIDKHCHRQFNNAGSATARVYVPDSCGRTDVDDFHTITGLVIKTDAGDDGTFETTWATPDYELEPLNGVVDGETGWPYWTIRTRRSGAQRFPLTGGASLQVTANWGWAAVPTNVKQACYLLSKDHFGLRDVKFGSTGGGEFGPIFVRQNKQATELLNPYVRDRLLVA